MAALNYNEKKTQKGQATCLYAANYLAEARELSFYQKLAGFERLNDLNERATTKTLHVSLNFDPSENLPNQQLVAIATAYMEKIGFGRQPFLLYRHFDAGHPHIHIVSTTIRSDGSRINTHNIGRNQSEKARKEIEQQYGLVKASGRRVTPRANVEPISITKAMYGKSETKQSIGRAVNAVFNEYKFSSLPEFNAALQQFNVVADRGKENGRIFQHRGLIYRIVDSNGSKMGVPIKASSIGCQPTLTNLEKKFAGNKSAQANLQGFLRAKVDECLSQSPKSLQDLLRLLQQKHVHTVLRQNAEGRVYGVTFVDNLSKLVCNGSDLGKSYSAMGLLHRLGGNLTQKDNHLDNKQNHSVQQEKKILKGKQNQQPSISSDPSPTYPLVTLLSAKERYEGRPYPQLKKKRKKKKRNPNE